MVAPKNMTKTTAKKRLLEARNKIYQVSMSLPSKLGDRLTFNDLQKLEAINHQLNKYIEKLSR